MEEAFNKKLDLISTSYKEQQTSLEAKIEILESKITIQEEQHLLQQRQHTLALLGLDAGLKGLTKLVEGSIYYLFSRNKLINYIESSTQLPPLQG